MKVAYLCEIFSPANLGSPDNLERSLSYVRSHIIQPSHQGAVRKPLQLLISSGVRTGLLEFIVAQDSVVLGAIIAGIRHPDPDDCLSKPAFDHDFLLYLYSSFRRLPGGTEVHPDAEQCQERAANLQEAFKALSTVSAMRSEERQNEVQGSKKQIKTRKIARKKGGPQPKDLATELATVLSLVGEKVPRTLEETGAAYDRLRFRRCQILGDYLRNFYLPDIQSQAKKIFLGSMTSSLSSTSQSISPVRAAQYFKDDADELGCWRIHISSRALRKVRQFAEGDAAISAIIHKKIRDLSHGFFSEWNHTKLAGGISEVPLYKAKMTGDLRMVYQIDCGPLPSSSDPGAEMQFIRVLDICNHNELSRSPGFWDELAATAARRDQRYRQRVDFREVPRMKTKGQYVTPPAAFGLRDATYCATPVTLSPEDCNQIHDTIVISKYYSYSYTLLEAARLCDDISGVFSTSDRENEVINYNSSSLVIGRSGTGKTTTIIFKMLDRELGALQRGEKVRQVFVTQSGDLASRVEENFHKMLRAVSHILGVDQNHELFPIRLDQAAGGGPGADHHTSKRWNELDSHEFPLFLTFEELCNLLENDCSPVAGGGSSILGGPPGARTAIGAPGRSRKVFGRKKRLTYRMFRTQVWPYLERRSSKYIDPMLLFNEFMGVIMGSEWSTATTKGYLDRDSYENLSSRAYFMFAEDRATVYSLFESYLKLRSSTDCGWYDVPQRTHILLHHVKNDLIATRADFLYVDEVQDHMIIDIQLLRLLCRNPQGHMWCGDTAQTIAAGSSFRFEELKAYLYRFEERDAAVVRQQRKAVHPLVFQLPVNYRSHSGIVEAAASIVNLISHYFPYAIDKLDEEEGLAPGEPPAFVTNVEESMHHEIFCKFAAGASKSHLEFGADQVILVRDQDSRAELEKSMGKGLGLILTLYESKGQEFNDVLLYNFFVSSPATAQDWQVLLNIDQQLLSDQFGHTPLFSHNRHGCLLGELKLLYVGLTRARENVWVIDQSGSGDALKALWVSRGLITNTTVESLKCNTSNSGTSSARWAARGHALFNQELYEQSALCFGKAECLPEKLRSLAYLQRDQALDIPSSNSRERKAAMLQAGAALRDCMRSAVPSWWKMLRMRAAECFEEAQEYAQAGELYKDAKLFEESVLAYRQGGHFDQAVSVLKLPDSQVSPSVANVIYDHAKVHYSICRETQKAAALFDKPTQHLKFLEELGFDDGRIEILEALEDHDEMAKICWGNRDYAGAVQHLCLSSSSASQDRAVQWLLEALATMFPLRYHDKTRTLNEAVVKELLGYSHRLSLNETDQMKMEVFRIISVQATPPLNCAPNEPLVTLGRQLLLLGESTIALLAFDEALNNPAAILTSESLQHVAVTLQDYFDYAKLLHRLVATSNPFEDWRIRAVLGIRAVLSAPPNVESGLEYDLQEIEVSTESLLYGVEGKYEPSDAATTDGNEVDSDLRGRQSEVTTVQDKPRPATRSCRAAESAMQRALLKKLNEVLCNLHKSATKIKALQVCASYFFTGYCRWEDSCFRQHLHRHDLNIFTYNERVRVHLLLIRVLDRQFAVDSGSIHVDGSNRSSAQRIWLERLFETINPSVSELGPFLNVLPELIPEYGESMAIVRSWIQERFLWLRAPSRLKYIYDGSLYFNGILATALLAFQLDRNNAIDYVPHGQWGRKVKWTLECKGMEFLGSYSEGKPLVELALGWLFDFPHSWEFGLTNAIEFIHTVVRDNLGLDINVFVLFIERVVAHAVLSRRKRRLSHEIVPQDGVTLSRSMLVEGMQIPPCKIPPQGIWTLAEAMGTFVENLTRAADPESRPHYWYLKSPGLPSREPLPWLSRLSTIMVVSRICNAMVLLGLNVANAPLQTLIRRTMNRLQPTFAARHSSFSNLRAYAWATSWRDLEKALKNNWPKSPFDGLVTVISEQHRGIPHPISGVEVISFSNMEDLINKVQPARSRCLDLEKPLSAVQSRSPVEELVAPPLDGDGAEEWQESSAAQASFAVEVTPEQEESASRLIQKAYQLYRRRVLGSRRCGVFFDKCREELKSGGSLTRTYVMMYLGPLPHILLFLDKVMKVVNSEKKILNGRLKNADHEEYGPLLDARKDIGRLCSSVGNALQKLGPASRIHQRSSLEDLHAEVEKVVALKQEISRLVQARRQAVESFRVGESPLQVLATDAEVNFDYDTGIKGIERFLAINCRAI